MTFLNLALRYHKDIDHWVIYHLKDVCEMCRRSLNHCALNGQLRIQSFYMRTAKALITAQSDLSLRLAHMPFCWFCHEAAQMHGSIKGLDQTLLTQVVFTWSNSWCSQLWITKSLELSTWGKILSESNRIALQLLTKLSRCMTKPTNWHVRPAKTQISPGIRPVWSESSLCT